MRAVLQRVSKASVSVAPDYKSSIGFGLLILLGVENADTEEDIDWLVRKIVNMRIFPDDEGKMNLSLLNKNHEALVVSQFTLHASTKKGNRPSFVNAAKPDYAEMMYEKFIAAITKEIQKEVKTGIFGGDMKVELINDGPVTIIIDSKEKQ
jgi:D-tyrosyl-tRNA(Tyr) deacylase